MIYPELTNIKDPVMARVMRVTYDIIRNLQENSQGPLNGTLFPDTKPSLGISDNGKLFNATDFARVFKWNGMSWEDAPGQSTRGRVAYFPPNTNPGAGWARSNGSTVLSSTTNGEVVKIKTGSYSSLNGLLAWIRL